MLELIGAMLVLSSGALIGAYKASLLSNRPKQLRQWIKALQRLETEIIYSFTPLSDALIKIGGREKTVVHKILKEISLRLQEHEGYTTAQIWSMTMEKHWESTSMKTAEKEVLLQLGTTLGLSDRDDQTKHIRLALSHLQTEEETAREDQQKYGKMWRTLGVLAGALIVILIY